MHRNRAKRERGVNTLRQASSRASPFHSLRSRTEGFQLSGTCYPLFAPAVAPKSSDSEKPSVNGYRLRLLGIYLKDLMWRMGKMEFENGLYVKIGDRYAKQHYYDNMIGRLCIYRRFIMMFADGLLAHEVDVIDGPKGLFVIEDDLIPEAFLTNYDGILLLHEEESI